MARKKKTNRTIENHSSLTKWIANPLSLVIIITFSGLLLAGKLWGDYRQQLQNDPTFTVSPEQLTFNQPPVWLNQQSLRDCANRFPWEGRSLLDTDLAEDVAKHLTDQSWIDTVSSIHKTSGGLEAVVRYRVPVGMVQIGPSELYPIDRRGFVLDGGDVTKNQVKNYYRIAIKGLRKEELLAGIQCPDRRVVESAAIAAATIGLKESLQLDGIYGFQSSKNSKVEFRFWTADRDEIIWGSAIGKETGQEGNVETKIERLKKLTVDKRKKMPGYLPTGGNVFDLRTGISRTATRPEYSVPTKRF